MQQPEVTPVVPGVEADPSPTQQTLILVVGMHRSGTSLLGSLLSGLGVAMPGPLLEGDQHNPEGYFERKDITALQENLLIAMGRWWPSAEGLLPLPADWMRQPATQATIETIVHLLKPESCGPATVIQALKDPRCSLLLPLWRQVAARLGLHLKLLLAIRDPAEVMVSLLQRDAVPAGMTAERAEQLWWRHNRQVLRDAADLPLEVIDYSRWFVDAPAQLERLALFCGHPPPSRGGNSQLLALIRPEHRRSHRPGSAGPTPAPIFRELYRRLAQLAAGPSQEGRQRRREKLQRWLMHPDRWLPSRSCGTRQQLRRWLARARLLALAPGKTNAWFDGDHYRCQVPELPAAASPLLHYLQHGWREGRSPHPLFDGSYYCAVAQAHGFHIEGPPFVHALRKGLGRGLTPAPWVDSRWLSRQGGHLDAERPPALAQCHPCAPAALTLSGGNPSEAACRLGRWWKEGFSAEDLALLAQLPSEPSALPLERPSLPDHFRLLPIGSDPTDWQLHAWLQHLPLRAGQSVASALFEAPAGAPEVHLNLADLAGTPQGMERISSLSNAYLLLDPSPLRGRLLRQLGLPVWRLSVTVEGNGWLDQAEDPAIAQAQLGLPPVEGLLQAPISHPEALQILCLGTAGETWERALEAPCWGIPGFDSLQIRTPEQARLLAAWLDRTQREGMQLVRLNPGAQERIVAGWRALRRPAHDPPHWQPAQSFASPLATEALAEELAWRRHGSRMPDPELVTPRPEHTVLFNHGEKGTASAAVCISLYNYADRITAALDSAAAQRHQELELIVVDDGSTDDGIERVLKWMDTHGQRFVRTQFLGHRQNAGLAAARNTAFAASTAPWSFVLDADNQLLPDAVSLCLSVADQASATTAVVYPLVEIRSRNPETARIRTLIGGMAWQREQFLHGNCVDAMALIRRRAWEAVGGFHHIPGGWEDFDFWCCLIDAGWHGLLCPQRLAIYNSHPASMLSTHTDRHVRRISRLLQARHPWLQLPMARADI